MKIDVVSSYCYIKEVYLVEDNIHTKTWSFDNIDCKYEHIMYKWNKYKE